MQQRDPPPAAVARFLTEPSVLRQRPARQRGQQEVASRYTRVEQRRQTGAGPVDSHDTGRSTATPNEAPPSSNVGEHALHGDPTTGEVRLRALPERYGCLLALVLV